MPRAKYTGSLLAILMALAFAVAFPDLVGLLGHDACFLAVIPSVAAALCWGFWGSLITWLLLIPVSMAVFAIRDIPIDSLAVSPYDPQDLATTLLVVLAIGYLAELHRQLRTRLKEATDNAAKLQLSRAQLQSSLDASQDAIVLIDTNRTVVALNAVSAHFSKVMTGRYPDIGSDFAECLDEPAREIASKLFDEAMTGHTAVRDKHETVVNGETRLFRVTAYPVVTDKGEVEGVCLYANDITDDARSIATREHEISLLNRVIDAIPIPVFYKGLDGRYAGCNSLYAELLGCTREDVVGRTLGEIVNDPESDKYRETDTKLLADGGRHVYEGPAAFGPGRLQKTIVLAKASFSNDAGEIAGIVGTITDITERKTAEDALRQSEAMFRLVFDKSPIGAAIVSLDWTITRVNEQLCEFLGYPEDELVGMSIDQLLHPEDVEEARNRLDQLLNGECDHLYAESRYIRKNGATVWGYRSVRLLRSDDGRPLHFITKVQDTTAQEALRRSEEDYRLLVEHQTDLVVKVDPDGQFLFVSPSYCQMFGLEEKDLLGKPFLPLVHEDDRASTLEAMKDLFRPPYECSVQQRAKTRHGWRWLAWACKAVTNSDGEVIEIVSVGRDVSEQVKTQQALQASEQRYHTVFASARDAMFVLRDDTFVDCNEQACTLFETTRDEIIGQGPCIFSPSHQPDGRPSVAAALGYIQAATRGEAQFFEWQHCTSSGEIRDTEVTLSPLEINGEEHLLAVVRDVTARRQDEHALKESQRKLSTLMSNLPGMAYRCTIGGEWVMEYVSDGCKELTGYGESELVGNASASYGELIHPDDRAYVTEKITLAVADRTAYKLSYRIRSRTGTEKWVWEQGRAVYDDDGSAVALEGLVIDVTGQKQAELELRLSDAILRQLPDAIIVTDGKRHITHWLGAAESLFGYTEEDVAGKAPQIVSPSPSADRLQESLEATLAQSGSLHMETVCRRKDGTTFPVDMTVKTLADAHGRMVAHIGVVRDITERRAAEDLLRDSEQKFRLLFESAPLGIVSFNARGDILDVNQRLMTILGLPSRDRAQSHTLDTLPRLSGTAFVDDVRSSLQSGQPVARELSCQLAWGGKEHLRYLLTPVRDDAGALTGLQAMIEDITDRMLSEQELRKLSAAVNQSASAICITDTNGRIEYTNPRFSQITGYGVMELVGRSTSLLKSGRHTDDFYREMWATISSGQVWSGLVQNRRKNGEFYWERKLISPVFSDDGRIMNYLSTSEDITTELLTQAKLSESEKMAAVGMLAAGVAHEFKNYLGGIIGNASFALEEIPEAEKLSRDTLEQIIQMGEKANQVAMSLLTYSKARPDDRSREDLRKLIRDTISLVEKELRIRSIELVTYFQDVPEVVVSASKIQQLLLNLIINAEHAISSSGVITVALLCDSDYVYLKVGDTGTGISPEHLHRVFDPFYSTKGAWGKDKLVGTGMGLPICRNIAREHGGELTIQTRVGVGSTFTLTLPINAAEIEAEPVHTPQGAAPRVLIFSLDTTIMRDYFEDACAAGVELLLSDSIADLVDDLAAVADVAVCDARFSGKVELLMFVEKCMASNVPYVTVNCGAMEYQLSDIYDHARANFADIPAFERLLERLGLGRTAALHA